jgi:hypothetical protein
MAIQVEPNGPGGEGHCLALEAGTLTVSVGAETPFYLAHTDTNWPVEFELIEPRVAGIIGPLTVSATTKTVTAPISGGLYCYHLTNLVPLAPDAPNAVRGNYRQGISLKMALAPQ